MDVRFLFVIYSKDKANFFPINKFGYGCWNGRQYTIFEARFNYKPCNPCASVNKPYFSNSSLQGKHFVNFTKSCLNGSRLIVKCNR